MTGAAATVARAGGGTSPVRLSSPGLPAGAGRHEAQPQEAAAHLPRGRAAGPSSWGRKRALGTRSLVCGRRFRILCVVDDYTRECLALVADTSLSGARVDPELADLVKQRGNPHTVVSDNGTELTSLAILRWSQERRYIASGKPMRNGFAERLASPPFGSMAVCATNASTRRCSPRWPMPGSCSLHGGTTTTRSGHTRNWAGRPPPRSPANVSGGMPPDMLPTHQTTIMKERDSTSE